MALLLPQETLYSHAVCHVFFSPFENLISRLLFSERNVDFMNLMAFDYHGPWDGVTGQNSPLYSLSEEIDSQLFLNVVSGAMTSK